MSPLANCVQERQRLRSARAPNDAVVLSRVPLEHLASNVLARFPGWRRTAAPSENIVIFHGHGVAAAQPPRTILTIGAHLTLGTKHPELDLLSHVSRADAPRVDALPVPAGRRAGQAGRAGGQASTLEPSRHWTGMEQGRCGAIVRGAIVRSDCAERGMK